MRKQLMRLVFVLAMVASLAGAYGLGQLHPVSAVHAADGQIYPDRIVGPDGFVADGGFADYWHRNGGLAIFGWPISNLFDQTLEDGKSYKVQYFERVRMEYHPENAPPYNVLLGQFGRAILNGTACSPVNTGGSQPPASNGPAVCNVPAVGSLDAMPKATIDMAPDGTWFHRVFNPRLFNAANNWGGADSWFTALYKGPSSGGAWTSYGNPVEIIFRANNTHTEWCLGVATAAQYKDQFMDGASGAAAMNVRIKPGSVVSVKKANGQVVSQATSDGGDITIILPDNGTVVVSVSFDMAAPTFESKVWFGPYDRSANINTVDAR